MKRLVLLLVLVALGAGGTETAAVATVAAPQCSDGIDNDRDGIVDWRRDPGCGSSRDATEGTPLTCDIDARMRSGQLSLNGECSGPFSRLEFRPVEPLNGRWSVEHAPRCSSTPKVIRCKAKEADKNPRHRVDAAFTTTSRDPKQGFEVRMIDTKGRNAAAVVLGRPPAADVAVEILSTPSAEPRERFKVRVRVVNNGPGTSGSVSVNVRLSGRVPVRGAADAHKYSGGTYGDGTWRLRFLPLIPGESTTLTLTVDAAAGTYTFDAAATVEGPDSNPENNRDIATTNVG